MTVRETREAGRSRPIGMVASILGLGLAGSCCGRAALAQSLNAGQGLLPSQQVATPLPVPSSEPPLPAPEAPVPDVFGVK